MKKYILIIAGMFLAFFAKAQSGKEEVELMQAAFGMDKRAAVAEFVKPAETQKVAFWEVYNEYETKCKELDTERIDLLKNYAKHYKKMSAEQADVWTKKVISLQKRTDGLIEAYYLKIKKVSDGKVATQFYLIENYILTGIRMQILKEVPFIEK